MSKRFSDITRRDFLNGTPLAVGTLSLTPWTQLFGAVASGDDYPPARTGLRGSHDGSWETMHARVNGQRWPVSSPAEHYDLVVVGAGISGLAAAWFYRQRQPRARVLVIDNHDDFGGHAKRNEFTIDGRTRIGYGGTESIDTPSAYSGVAKQLLRDLGVDVQRFYEYYDRSLYASMGKAVYYDAATYGNGRLATGYGTVPWDEFARRTPMSEQARADLVRVFTERRDYLPDLDLVAKRELLSRTSYYDFLKDFARVDDQVLEMYRRWGLSFWCVGIEEIPAIQVQGYDDGGGMPGLAHTMPRAGHRGDEPYIFHFPDGNASIARLLVRALRPDAVPGNSMEDVVTARVAYERLDARDAEVRIRLQTTAVDVRHAAGDRAVDVTCVTGGRSRTVRAGHCILACYNAAIPYLVPDLPAAQAEGLRYAVKVPLVYTKVMARHWRPFAELDVSFVYYTKDFYKQVELDFPVSIGDYRFGSSPDDPMVLHMCHVPYFEDIRGPEQWRAGRRQLLGTPFETYERHVVEQLDLALGDAGFDVERDILAITVNRWSHGYAYNPTLLWEPVRAAGEAPPWVVGRAPFGRITIANSDAGASADTNTAITEARRAVDELP